MKVLIVDDDIATVDVISSAIDWEMLKIEEVFEAYNIDRAKKILLEEKIDIIISDIEMPRGSGIDLLKWVREKEFDIEILFLTCHENFSYATNALKLNASEYLLKPFDTDVMEVALKKMIRSIREERLLKEYSEYGRWAERNKRQLKLNFWNMLLDGHISMSSENIIKELNNRKLAENPEIEYHLVISRVTGIERDKERLNTDLIMFILENVHSEILCGTPENTNVICYNYKDYYLVATVCKEDDEETLKNLTKEVILELKKILMATIACCISTPCKMTDFYETYNRGIKIISSNSVYFGDCFLEKEIIENIENETVLLDFNEMDKILSEKKKIEFLSYIKKRLNEKVYEKRLSAQTLEQAKQEILQAVYSYLAKREIQISGLLADENFNAMTQKASLSMIDMMRWNNFLIERIFEYENEVKKGYTIIEKINKFIREHYRENIGRNEISAEFYLAPEYLAKMYKRQTGISLKDYINEYRIKQAKLLLEKEEMQISDVAETVGFDNFTYFSTLFKKYTGMSPNSYRKKSI